MHLVVVVEEFDLEILVNLHVSDLPEFGKHNFEITLSSCLKTRYSNTQNQSELDEWGAVFTPKLWIPSNFCRNSFEGRKSLRLLGCELFKSEQYRIKWMKVSA
ncbi:hypothetical protein AVEN_124131-1 [Araneus ventricosus]|uniref:Uncharacterized protein n=1 Tax=Araneus ventricosus TaxID=182803 RepID=A0A4Y2I5A7_ARAVE|nr:hypothetical protein AVEN_124131-1 [Araneus ventricosus]